MALQFSLGGLERKTDSEDERASAEQVLNDWLRENAVIGYKPCGYVVDVERAILDATASPLNIARKNPTGYARLLQGFRHRFRTEVIEGWPKPTRTMRPVRH